jgi:hypothetical protein
MVDEETQEQMNRLSALAKTLGLEYDYDTLSLECLVFLNDAENTKKKDTDWLKYFLMGHAYGLATKKRWDDL